MKKWILALCTASTLLVAGGAAAQGETAASAPEYGRDGWYIQAGYAHIWERAIVEAIESQAPTATASVSSAPSFDLRAGTRVLPHLAVELAFQYIPNFEVSTTNPVPPPTSGRGEVDMLMVSANVKVPFTTTRVQPYAIGGVGLAYGNDHGSLPTVPVPPPSNTSNLSTTEQVAKVDGMGALLRFGGGVDVYITKNVVWMVEGSYNWTIGEDVTDWEHASLLTGFAYRF